MEREFECLWCGSPFMKAGLNHNQKYCCGDCYQLAKNEKSRELYKQRKTSVTLEQPNITIQAVLNLADELSTKYGRVFSYGDVQSMLYAREINISGGVIK